MDDITKYLIFRDCIAPIAITGIVLLITLVVTIAESIEEKIDDRKRKKRK